MTETIFAKSSGLGKAGVSVFRISGPRALQIGKLLTRMQNMVPRKMYFRAIYDDITSQIIDNCMVVFFKGPRSFTGEDTIELHTHGSIAIDKILTKSLLSAGLRIAEAGEFSKRSFLNGKMDLTQAEGLADLIEAETEMQHAQAIRQANGELERLYESWRVCLLEVVSFLEAYIDFPEDEIEINFSSIDEKIIKLEKQIISHLDDNKRGQRLKEGLRLAIIGEPNVGKSSLMNFLSNKEVSIVSNIPGTTRDVLESWVDIGGYPIVLMDTAGIRSDTLDEIEKQGINKAQNVAQNADIRILIFDVHNYHSIKEKLKHENTIIVINKIDIEKVYCDEAIKISIKEKTGLTELISAIEKQAQKIALPQAKPVITNARYRHALEKASLHMNNFLSNVDLVLKTEDIRTSISYLSFITGKIEVEEVLAEIFSKFCIGK